MPQTYRGGPSSVSRFVRSTGQIAVLVPREQTHFSKLRNGYPLAEEFLNHLARANVEAVVIDDGARLYVFGLHQYRTGNRIGHAPYPMKRVATLDDAIDTLDGKRRDAERRAAEWEWLTEADLRPGRDRTHGPNASSSAFPSEGRDESMTSD